MKHQPPVVSGKMNQCPLCAEIVSGPLRFHIVSQHGETAFRQAVLADKARGVPDAEIGERYSISFGTLERLVTEAYGANITIRRHPKRIQRWSPPNFREETTTVWSFKQRGDWVTHDGRYRGNWSPYIPRNIILKYSRPGDTVLDYFVGGGTTAVEAKLLGRRCIARDINPGAVGITLENLRFSPPHQLGDQALPIYEPQVSVGDARDLSDIPDRSIDLICAHPPYAGIIKYSTRVAGDLSNLPIQEFLAEMEKVARESMRVLKPGGKCAILIGDARKAKQVVPIGFQIIRVFLNAGFVLKELVIKRQHNCRATGFWYTRSIQHNFLLLAHEYLPIFEKPFPTQVREPALSWGYTSPHRFLVDRKHRVITEKLETTTVWLFPRDRLESEIKRNLLGRFALPGDMLVEMLLNEDGTATSAPLSPDVKVLYIRSPERLTVETFVGYRTTVQKIIGDLGKFLPFGCVLALEAEDFRSGSELMPAGLLLWEDMEQRKDFSLKEIVIVAPEDVDTEDKNESEGCLNIVHRYLLIYVKSGQGKGAST